MTRAELLAVGARVAALRNVAPVLLDLAEAVQRWRAAKCRGAVAYQFDTPDPNCHGDNHVEDCPVERARQDVLSASNKLEAL